ncbi:MAG: zinc ABC transporter permease [Deltaproteobacteria bacterium]|jgi:zinc transport system permease protein|nr:zinc ABC transporter permease [Deltaproteobacteria bacterium]MBQ31419.1 zinc ABC transporter permease [Deltaproteobacteria bacterium]MDP7318226.1 zinc ABC transporter permease subunit ZnuB [SAR324 cluster bacterium]MDP7630014.1 zinc ABC transporter permease subunit ZnuB [SAR324 cluster bacterium]
MILDDFFWRALLAGAGVALAAGPLGCFVVWRRMAYFGDTMAHSSLLGVALGFLLGIDLMLGVFAVVLVVALLLFAFQQQRQLAGDAVLGTLSHASLALGVLVISLMPWVRVDLMSYLFGDILAVTVEDLLWIYGGGVVALGVLLWIWRPLLAVTVDEALAQAEGIPAMRLQLLFMLLIAGLIALALKIVGILLVTSLLIIPATAARRYSRTPEQMAVGAALVGVVSVGLGLTTSLHFDTPSGPSIVVAAVIFFLFSVVPLPRSS